MRGSPLGTAPWQGVCTHNEFAWSQQEGLNKRGVTDFKDRELLVLGAPKARARPPMRQYNPFDLVLRAAPWVPGHCWCSSSTQGFVRQLPCQVMCPPRSDKPSPVYFHFKHFALFLAVSHITWLQQKYKNPHKI